MSVIYCRRSERVIFLEILLYRCIKPRKEFIVGAPIDISQFNKDAGANV